MNSNIKSVKLLDCTIRDGGLSNDSNFSDSFVIKACKACSDAGIDIFEIGFRNDRAHFDPNKFGKWRYCDDSDVEKVLKAAPNNMKISELVDAGKCDWQSIPAKPYTPVDMIRCAFYEPQRKQAIDIVKACSDKGYETSLCMMAASTLDKPTICSALKEFSASSASCIYLMDSFGALYPQKTRELSAIYSQAAHSAGKLFGIHCHNNLQCAFANTLAALLEGADIADCTISGLGKGAGNCPTEMLAFAMREKYSPRPLLEFAQEMLAHYSPALRRAFDAPYMLTGLFNSHPRPAMEFEDFAKIGVKQSLLKLYDSIAGELSTR